MSCFSLTELFALLPLLSQKMRSHKSRFFDNGALTFDKFENPMTSCSFKSLNF